MTIAQACHRMRHPDGLLALDVLPTQWHVAKMMRPPPPLLAIAAAVTQSALTPKDEHRPPASRAAAAMAIAAASGALAAAAAGQFRRQGTTVEPFNPALASVLVTTGPNAVSRNPMYVGLTGLLVANAVRLGSGKALLPVAAFTLVIDRLQIRAEESALLANFGADYEAYRATVPRWLGLRSVPRRPSRYGKRA
jgi:protein-S-isoprenylcysteine O-methyltransferase Ste14